MAYRRIQERNFEPLVYAAFSENKDNNAKSQAAQEVTALVNEGGKVYKVETLDGIFAGIQVIKDDEILYSKFRS